MRALAPLVLALATVLVAVAAEGHAHAVDHRADHCAVCVLRAADVPEGATPDPMRPADREAGEAAASLGPAPVCGAPLGAIPGQSPPCSA